MARLNYARSHRDLIAYQKARSLANEIFQLTKIFPREEMYSLTDQIRRCSRSVGAQIAEARAKRRYEKHFVSKLTDADGEQHEVQHWLETALDCGYLNPNTCAKLIQQSQEVGRLLQGMMDKAGMFCAQSDSAMHESQAEYLIPPA